MKLSTLLTASLLVGVMSSSVAAEPLPEGAVQPSTLANQQLMQDAMTGVAAKVDMMGCDTPEELYPYVMAMPEGSEGAQQWKELWMVQGCDSEFPVEIRFSEAGPNAADYVIE
ncbi:hypothetical protein [Vreelandella sp. EE27]